jgi:hypothetical protein
VGEEGVQAQMDLVEQEGPFMYKFQQAHSTLPQVLYCLQPACLNLEGLRFQFLSNALLCSWRWPGGVAVENLYRRCRW